MKIIANWWSLLTVIAVLGSAHAQDMDKEHKATLEAVISFYKSMAERGDPQAKAAAERLEKAMKAGKVRFGAVKNNANAEADPATGEITINRNYVGRLTTTDSDVFLHRADLGATLLHEFRHLDQSSFATFGGTISGIIGLGNPAERQGWREAFDGMTRWINATQTLLREAERKGLSAREQVRLAQELKLLCDSWHNFKDNYPDREYGSIKVNDPNDPEGPEVSLSTALGYIERVRDYANERIQIGKVMAEPYDGIYDGTFSTVFYSGKVTIMIRGENVDVTLSGGLRQEFKDIIEGIRSGVKEFAESHGFKSKGEKYRVTWIKKLKGTINYDGIILARSDDGVTFRGTVISNNAKGSISRQDDQMADRGHWEAVKRSK